MNKEVKLSEREEKVLNVLAYYRDDEEERCVYMKTIAEETKLTVVQVRRSVRALARKGLAEYHRGLFDEDGKVAGSGYCASEEGMAFIRKAEEELQRKEEMEEAQQTLI